MRLSRRSSGLRRFSSSAVSKYSVIAWPAASRMRCASSSVVRVGTDRVVAPLEELREVGLGKTDQRQEDRRRQRRREVFVELALAAVDELVDDLG